MYSQGAVAAARCGKLARSLGADLRHARIPFRARAVIASDLEPQEEFHELSFFFGWVFIPSIQLTAGD